MAEINTREAEDKGQSDDVITCHAIGFSLDNFLINWNAEALTRLFVKSLLAELHSEFDYPDEILDLNFTDSIPDPSLVSAKCVWDIGKGALLWLNSDHEILSGSVGFKTLKRNEICRLY